MIFSAEMARAIKAGKKTQTRRLSAGCRYKRGRVYAIQTGRGKPASGHITVISEPYEQPLGEISFHDARREGFRTVADFKAYWTELHGSFEADGLVWVISFELGDTREQR